MKLRRVQAGYESGNPPCETLRTHPATVKPEESLFLRTLFSPLSRLLILSEAPDRGSMGDRLSQTWRHLLMVRLSDSNLSSAKESSSVYLLRTGLINRIHQLATGVGPALLSGPILPGISVLPFMRPVVVRPRMRVSSVATAYSEGELSTNAAGLEIVTPYGTLVGLYC